MERMESGKVEGKYLKGRIVRECIGASPAPVASDRMTVGFARYCEDVGPMEPHHHAEETIYVVSAKNVWVRFGGSQENLDHKVDLKDGDLLHFPELEWHVFEYSEGGFLDIVYIYGQTTNIRPEDVKR
jgi:mannose-6-phosphate isomerase-like protein (cupin superfamily)